MVIKIDETLRQRIKNSTENLTQQLDHLNKILALGEVKINEVHLVLPDFSDALWELEKRLREIIQVKQWLKTLPDDEALEGLHEVVSTLRACLHISKNQAKEKS
jgi:hypothetical protein